MRTFIFATLLIFFILWRVPAILVDYGIDRLSEGKFRLTESAGTVWQGKATLGLVDSVASTRQPWLPVEWELDPRSLLHGIFSWDISYAGSVSRVEVSLTGLSIYKIQLFGPASFFSAHSNTGKYLGLEGDVTLDAARFHCSWQWECNGRITAGWFKATSHFLSHEFLGNYLIVIDGSSDGFQFHWSTIEGPVTIDGNGAVGAEKKLSFEGNVTGDERLLSGLSSVCGKWCYTGRPGMRAVLIP